VSKETTMMTWEAVVAHVRDSFAVIETSEEQLAVGWQVGEAVHVQRVELVTAYGQPWLRVVSPVERGGLSAEAILRHNASLAIGSFSIEGDALVLQHLAPLACTTPAHVSQILRSIAHEAVRFGHHGLRVDTRPALEEFHFYVA
jgi:hypothetical protein